MNDIVKRLREQSEYNDPANGLGALCGEAADEIVRLRAALRHVCDIYEQTGADGTALMYSYAKAAIND